MAYKYFYVGIAVFAGIQMSLPASARPTPDSRTAIAAAYASMDQAVSRRDLAAIMTHIAPGIIAVDQKGVEMDGKDNVADKFRQGFASPARFKSSTHILTFLTQDGGAVVTAQAVETVSGTRGGQPLVIKIVQTVRHFWVKRNGPWMISRERILTDSETFNGQSAPSTP